MRIPALFVEARCTPECNAHHSKPPDWLTAYAVTSPTQATDESLSASDHFVQFFEVDAQLVDAVSGFVERGVRLSEVCVVIVTPQHRQAIGVSLQARGLDVVALEATYRYIVIDAESMLAEFLDDSGLHRRRFHERADMLLRQASASDRPVRVFGGMVAILAARGSLAFAIELEELWNELCRSHNFVLFCAYPLQLLTSQSDAQLYRHICAVHQHSPSERAH